eukprot:CAMPEP_0118971784 /NCGR_PEP_ID=MMETSP1173-20130426/8312_1 /TAXON_ID=1034831 /ORGANISM="Rhizochromulina marina cf, Strain CCMP1243" /LENGTH=77 /DNA_ID=CAMNT_0006921273 /DNA_START=22 /DNA_END=255 /DNA_ORIENTATION=-
MAGAPRNVRKRNEKAAGNINRRGKVPVGSAMKRESKPALGPWMVGFFMFVVVGSSVFALIQQCLTALERTGYQANKK